MNNLYTEPDKFEDADFQENESYEISPVFEIYNEDQQMNFIAWILNMSEQELARGKDFLIEYNTSFRVLWKLLSQCKYLYCCCGRPLCRPGLSRQLLFLLLRQTF